jgi:hypothetical protein
MLLIAVQQTAVSTTANGVTASSSSTLNVNNMNTNSTSSSSRLVLTEREKSQLEVMQTVMETAARHLM